MEAYPMGKDKKFDVKTCHDRRGKKPNSKPKTSALDKAMKNNEPIAASGQNGEVIPVNQLGGVKSYKYIPELDGPVAKQDPMKDPIPPSEMEESLDKMNDKIQFWGKEDEKKLQKKLDETDTFPENPYRLKPVPAPVPAPKPIPQALVLSKPVPLAHGVMCEELLLTRPISTLYCKPVKPQVAYVLGGGHSTEPYLDLLTTKAAHTFGCSGTPLLFPELKHWYSCDVVKTDPMIEWFWNRSQSTIKVLSYESYHNEEVPNDCAICKTPKFGPSEEPDKYGLWHGCSSTIGACEIARLMGYRAIYLFGVDYDKRTHPFDKVDPQQGVNMKDWDQARIGECWLRFMNAYRDFRCQVFNCNKDSLLVKMNILPYADPYRAFQGS